MRTFVDLTEEGELDPYDEWLAEEARAAGVEVAYHRHAIRDLDVPTSDGMRAILDLIESAITPARRSTCTAGAASGARAPWCAAGSSSAG